MQKMEMDKLKQQMRQGGANPWAVDYSEDIHKAQAPVEGETLIDKAKSFSF